MSNEKKQIQAKNYFVIFRVERESKTKSGIVLPFQKNGQYSEKEEWLRTSPAIVISVGPDVKNIKIGDRIILGATKAARYDNLAEMLEEKKSEYIIYFAAKEEDIVAVIN